MSNVPPPLTPSAEGKPNSCLMGCLVLGVFLAVVAVVGGFGMYISVKSMYDKVTDTEPMQIQRVSLSDEEKAALQTKVETFASAMDRKNSETEFKFTGKELNALIEMFPQAEWLVGAVYLQVLGSRVFGDVSFPLERFAIPGGRYINGQATFEIGLLNGRMSVFVTELSVKGEPVSEQFMQGLSVQNLAQGMNEDVNFKSMLERIESIVVNDSLVIVKLYD